METETQVIVPAYYALAAGGGDVIYAAQGIIGGTGVTYEGEDVEWLDINVDGRYWCKEYGT